MTEFSNSALLESAPCLLVSYRTNTLLLNVHHVCMQKSVGVWFSISRGKARTMSAGQFLA
ncbi:uncharacterized protein PHALS_15453 [Plasmopara halstedii]|uniref:Uncharacterized protein n=1 Tax=Plasmopara halstedii TaxID=4781 RepID=A0A0P1ATE7_PLAHL|nr:uncharacterized protein PHALS_15453 [Plasmopara halstedii]CEG44745.1 hypothetical protein PHALS_15453 [Plasmopara halstedii]|eukprot:XP_024581114.1 hypothetical protein PHALS_15453 [Plasmopara halstedii]